MPHFLSALACLSLIAACAQFPELDTVNSRAAAGADYPQLVPLGPLLAGVGTDLRIQPDVPRSLQARAAALRARAAALRGSPLNAAERTRLRAAGQRNAARIAGG